MVALLLGVWPACAGIVLTNVATVNVTPSGFSVVGAVLPATGPAVTAAISVYTDSGGTTSLAGQVGVELYPLNSGNPGATNDYDRQQSMAALRQDTMALGLVHVRVSDCAPGTTYYYRLTVSNTNGQSAQWPPASLAAVTTPAANAFAAQSDELFVTLNDSHAAGAILTLVNTNTGTTLAAVVGDGAPANQAFFSLSDLINAGGGGGAKFAPVGNEEFAASLLGAGAAGFTQDYALVFSNNFIVSQSGQFAVGQYSAVVAFGQDAQLAGGSGSVALSINTGGPLANGSFLVNVPTNLFSSLSVQSESALIGSITMQIVSSNMLLFNFHAVNGEDLKGSEEIAQLNYTTVAGQDSRFLGLVPQAMHGTNSDFSLVNMLAQPGRIVIVGPQPLVDTAYQNGARNLVLYGLPSETYQIQSSTNLRSAANWMNLAQVTLATISSTLSNLDASPSSIFYRAYEIGADAHIAQPPEAGVSWKPLLPYTLRNSAAISQKSGSLSPASDRAQPQ